jgi:hypothetical protein
VELDGAVAVVHSFLADLGHLYLEAGLAKQSLAQMGCEPREEHRDVEPFLHPVVCFDGGKRQHQPTTGAQPFVDPFEGRPELFLRYVHEHIERHDAVD